MKRSGEEIRQSLFTMLTQADIDFDMWVAMRRARAAREVVVMLNRRYGRFYISAENAFFNSLITILYAVFEKRRDTVNFWSLRNTLPESEDPVALAEIDMRLASIKAAWTKIGILRNEVVGHQSLKRSSQESHEIAGVTINDIRAMIDACQELLRIIASRFHDTGVNFDLRGAATFENLMTDLRSSDAFQKVIEKLQIQT